MFVCTLFWMALQRHRMKRPGAARTEKAFKINVPSAIVRSVASSCAYSAGRPAMIAWKAAAGPTVRRQGSRCARPAPPACGLDCAPLARLCAAMRSWLAVRNCAQVAEEEQGRSTTAGRGVDIGRSVDRSGLPQWRHGSPSQIAATASVGPRIRRSLRLCACARASWPTTSEARFGDVGGDGRLAEGRAGD